MSLVATDMIRVRVCYGQGYTGKVRLRDRSYG